MTISELGLKQVRVITPNGLREVNLTIDKGKISRIKATGAIIQADRLIDGKNRILLPQTIDTHVHFREPGYTNKEDFETGSHAAAAGGINTIIDMPNNQPPTTTPQFIQEKIQIGMTKSLVNFGVHAGFPQNYELIPKLMEKGAASIKIYTTELEDPAQTLNDLYTYSFSNNIKVKLSLHAEDPDMIRSGGKTASKDSDIFDFADSRPPSAEESMIHDIIRIIKNNPVPTHICHVSTSQSLKLIIHAKKKGLPITCEIAPHHYFLNMEDDHKHGPILKCNPPVRSRNEMKSLQEALNTGYVDNVASDHAPHTREEKDRGFKNIHDAPSGIVGLETLIATLFTLNHRNLLTLSQIKYLLHDGPAKSFNLNKHEISVASPANITIVDPDLEWRVKGSLFHGKTKFTPFEGKKLVGKVTHTIVNGILVYEEGEIIAQPGHAKFITPSLHG